MLYKSFSPNPKYIQHHMVEWMRLKWLCCEYGMELFNLNTIYHHICICTWHSTLFSVAWHSTRPAISVNPNGGIRDSIMQGSSHSAATRMDCANKLCLKTLVEVHIHSVTTHALTHPAFRICSQTNGKSSKVIKIHSYLHTYLRTSHTTYDPRNGTANNRIMKISLPERLCSSSLWTPVMGMAWGREQPRVRRMYRKTIVI